MKDHKVRLLFSEDDNTGEYGLVIEKCQEFNSFWNGIGIFHDVFEHWFEDVHPYFRGDNFQNVGGEVAAMGAMCYYVYGMSVMNRPIGRTFRPVLEDIKMTAISEIQEGIYGGYSNFGSSLECGVPYQRSTHNAYLESLIEDAWYDIQHNTKVGEGCNNHIEDLRRSRDFRKSVTLGKLQRLFRWGYYSAKRLVPENFHNTQVLSDFITYWDKFCKSCEAETMSRVFRWVDFTISVKNKELSWTAEFWYQGGGTKILRSDKLEAHDTESMCYSEIEYE